MKRYILFLLVAMLECGIMFSQNNRPLSPMLNISGEFKRDYKDVKKGTACILQRVIKLKKPIGQEESTLHNRTLGVITPYRSQIALIRKEIQALGISALNEISVDTVERYQGSERDVIIYSFCVNYLYQLKFLPNLTEENGVWIDRKLNVALTRARRQLYITGVPDILSHNLIYRRLIQAIN